MLEITFDFTAFFPIQDPLDINCPVKFLVGWVRFFVNAKGAKVCAKVGVGLLVGCCCWGGDVGYF
ncbi:MAG TPA: hypothetical protein DEG17_18550 [Cyanobacteria bacterium UBA11149]|nr:hypothetical protein [Cyanobacteria bacterium UBA11367]HBE60105.1 hypothetical protein [Cyanobacteria bacterium UBA11366]HBK62681.1 hypothetical protein [Cyanobacteria bacterium UBA11166]HBS71635.1 hypothetical protein [Cyanobacteria bacterium UBA11153]HBW90811.1 hypothetical protein [Cyanobacteria bacterium UBA11149]HCA97720.1 hypothetical protein [Cyanobacteria bacterium UBA9226]